MFCCGSTVPSVDIVKRICKARIALAHLKCVRNSPVCPTKIKRDISTVMLSSYYFTRVTRGSRLVHSTRIFTNRVFTILLKIPRQLSSVTNNCGSVPNKGSIRSEIKIRKMNCIATCMRRKGYSIAQSSSLGEGVEQELHDAEKYHRN